MSSLTPLQGTLGTRRAAHLLRRLSFHYTKNRVDLLAGMTAADAVSTLLTIAPLQFDEPIYDFPDTPEVENEKWMTPGTTLPAGDGILRRFVVAWWLGEAQADPGARHKMMMFLHQYNVVAASSAGNTHFFDYLSLLRWGAFGNWKKFAKKLVFDNCMLRYLNNTSNTANNPQENFAREFLELFTIGKGPQAGDGDYTNYTEEDIVQAAKVLTGCRAQIDRLISDPETGIPTGRIQANVHNWTEKKFSPRLQELTIPAVTIPTQRTEAKVVEELDLFVNRIFDQPETARNFCRRLYYFFVNEKITQEIEDDIIIPLATAFKNGGYEIKPVLQQLFQSQHFFGEDNTTSVKNIIGGIIKSPLDTALQAISMFGMPIPDASTAPLLRFRLFGQGVSDRMLTLAGMSLFQPSDVAGYPAYYQSPDFSHQWFNSSSIIARYKLGTMLLSGRFTIGENPTNALGSRIDIPVWVKNSGFFTEPSDPYMLVLQLLEYMLPKEVDNSRFNYFYQTIFLDNLPPADWTYEWENYLSTNNSTEVKIALERLVVAIMYSQEYQTH